MKIETVTELRHPGGVVRAVILAAGLTVSLCVIGFGCACYALWVREISLVAVTGFLFNLCAVALYGCFLRNGLLRSMVSTFVIEDGRATVVRHRGRELAVNSQENKGGVLRITTSSGRFCFIGKR